MIVAQKAFRMRGLMLAPGHEVPGEAWATIQKRTKRLLLEQRWVRQVESSHPTPKRGRPRKLEA